MSLFKDWEDLAYKNRTQEEYDEFWESYLTKEKNVYESLLLNKTDILNGKLSEFAIKYEMNNIEFTGFMYGINTSLVNAVNVEELDADTVINAKIDFEKLYYNMHDAKADWLYNLNEWDNILTKEKRKEIKAAYNRSKIVVNENKIGRNDPCPCGSGKKYKKCCGANK